MMPLGHKESTENFKTFTQRVLATQGRPLIMLGPEFVADADAPPPELALS